MEIRGFGHIMSDEKWKKLDFEPYEHQEGYIRRNYYRSQDCLLTTMLPNATCVTVNQNYDIVDRLKQVKGDFCYVPDYWNALKLLSIDWYVHSEDLEYALDHWRKILKGGYVAWLQSDDAFLLVCGRD